MICNICNKEFRTSKELTKHLIKDHSFSIGELYAYFNYSFTTLEATCPICGNQFSITKRQLKKYIKDNNTSIGCSLSCTRTLISMFQGSPFSRPDVREKSKKTMLSKYGVEHSTQSKEILDKIKQTNLSKYGVENVLKSKEIKEKVKQTNLSKYGVEHPAQSKEILDKIKQTNLSKYGVEHPAQSKEVLSKMKATTFKRYGVENASQAEEIKERKKQTCLEHYGVEYPGQIPEIKAEVQKKIEQTNLERLGCKRPAQSSEILKKIADTNFKKFGSEFPISSEEFQEKAKQTNLSKYGVDNVFKSAEFREKAQQSNMKKYGVKFASQSPIVLQKMSESNLERYGVEYFCQHEKCLQANGTRISKLNKKFQKFLNDNDVKSNLEFIIENVGYDLKVGYTLIEIDPYFTHNTTYGPCFNNTSRRPISEDYHLNKTNKAKKFGYSCIHVFDWDDWDKIVMLLKNKGQIYARNCEVREVSKKEARLFLESFHLQGSTRSLQYAYGLFYESKLVQIMTFGKPRYNKKYEYELLRLCTLPEVSVVGGPSKLLKYFEKQVNSKSIISYCDLSKFSGEVYNKLGFKLISQTAPTKHWYNPKTKRHITDNLLRQRGFDQLHNSNYGKGTSNEQLMLDHGYVEIYDCGQLVFVKNI